jgi:hypothetical protein
VVAAVAAVPAVAVGGVSVLGVAPADGKAG